MPDHVLEYLDAYYDGELNVRLSQKVADHLASCSECRHVYEDMHTLSETLTVYALPDFTPEERFASQVALYLPREQEAPIPEKAFQIGWWLIPVLLVSTAIINNAVMAVNHMLLVAGQFGWIPFASEYTIPTITLQSVYGLVINTLGSVLPASMQWLNVSEEILQPVLSNIFLQLAIGILYLCWLALWWSKHTRQGSGQSSEQ